MKRYHFYFILSLTLLSGCIQGGVSLSLTDVESYIMDSPDSALVVLESMDCNDFKSKRDKAHYSLLYVMALDKNFIDVKDDSLARVAVDYFSRRGPKKYEAQALYYLGLSYYYSRQYDKAIIEFTKAESVAQDSDSLYWGMTKVKQADTYAKNHNNIEKLNCLQKACEIYETLDVKYYQDVTLLYLAETLFNLDREEEAEELLIKLIEDENVNIKIKNSALISYAFLKANPEIADFEESVKLYEKIISDYDYSYMSYKDFWAMSYSLARSGRKKESQDIVNQINKVDTSGTSFYWKYMIAKSEEDYESALKYLEISTKKIDKEIAYALQESLALTQRDYYKSVSEIADYKTKNRNLIIVASIGFSLLVFCLILWLSLKRIRQQREEMDKYLNYADEIRRQLEAYEKDDYPSLKKKYVELFKSKFEMIGSLYEQYSLSYGKKNAEHSIYEKVSEIVRNFEDDYVNTSLIENMLDDGLDGIMTNLHNEVPGLHEKDYMVFRLMAVNFDVTTISHLMSTTMNSIYIRKSRLKSHIEKVNPEHKSQFMSIFH